MPVPQPNATVNSTTYDEICKKESGDARCKADLRALSFIEDKKKSRYQLESYASDE